MSQIVENLKKNPSILFGIVALLVLGAVGILRANQLDELSNLEAELEAKLDRMSLNIKHSDNIEQETQRLRELVGAVDEGLFVANERSINIDFFYSLEDKLNMVISEVDQLTKQNIRYSKDGPDDLKRYSVIDYEMTVKGSFLEILQFMYEVHQITPVMRVLDFQIDPSTDIEETPGLLSAKIRIAVLARK